MVARRHRVSLDSLRLIDTIHRHGSFAAAARELCVVTSSITHAVRGLEDRLGLALFDRSGREARLTDQGRSVLEGGRELLARADAFDDAVQQLATGWPARMTIAVDEVIPMAPVVALVAEFCAVAPQTSLRLQREAAAGSWDALLSGRADLAIGAPSQGPAGGGWDSAPLVEIAFVLVVAAGHALAGRRDTLADAELAGHRAVVLADTTRRLPHLPYGLLDNRLTLAVPDEATKLQALLAGLGCGFLPRAVAEPYVDGGQLWALTVSTPHPPSRSVVAWRSGEEGRGIRWWVNRVTVAEPPDPKAPV